MVVLERPFVRVHVRPRRPFGGASKRAGDVLIAIVALLLLCPLILLICLAVKCQDGGPVLFVQKRVGLNGASFPFLKFRSMVTDASTKLDRILAEDPAAAREWKEKQKLSNDPRVTPLGKLLRRTSLDELPQFVNVLAGHMSIVGPRPMLERQVGEYGDGFSLYCTARPGITGLWQVSGRNHVSFRRRAELDEVYLQRWSLVSDLSLLARTAGAVVSCDGAS
jgi:lipopolysaccharide/colanic/teichoic acid biosynthesis glycosyltransferase